MKSTLAAVAVGILVAMAMADPLRLGAYQPKSAVGTCPAKDGEFPTYLPDSSDCTVFYECSGGTPFPKDCMPGLCFDSTLNVCAFPDSGDNETYIAPLTAVGTCPPRDTNATIYLTDSANCSIYYICSNGQAIERECLVDMSWNTKLNICDWSVDVECTLENNGDEYLYMAPLSAVGTCPPRDGNATVFLSDDKNCSVYYICSNGIANKQECTPEMAWNSDLNVCDWAVDVNCKSGDSNGTYEYLAPLTAVGTCPPRDTNATIYLTDSANCSIYYICSNGQAIERECLVDMSWNTKLNICDWSVDVECTLSRKPFSVVGTCPEKDPATPVYFPDSESCSLYYECSNGVAVQNVCPPDQEFSPTLHVCTNPLDSGCKATGDTTTQSPDTPDTTTSVAEETTTSAY